MSVQSRLGRWDTAGWVILLVGAGLLTRSACAPVPPSGARAPSTPAVEAQTARAADETTTDAPPAEPAASTIPQADGLEPSATPPARNTPFTAAKDPQATSADDNTTAPVASSGALPAIERQELALLASIERDLKREPPPEVHALLGKYRRGADRATLLTSVQRELPNDLTLRVTVLRWIDQVRPEPGGPAPAPALSGQGTGKSWVRPLQRQ
jgi:hypothetical protein